MTFIARMKGPLGQKGEKRKPRSASKTKAEKDHMEAVDGLPCLVCGAWPVEVHHEGEPRSNMRVLPLCPPHHRREFGPGAYHYSKRAFYAAHGSSEELLKRVERMLTDQEDEALGNWF
ncbi:hypothetical protein Q0601_00725 [Paracoccus onubensis]|uniref:hypothetical protein n=1 Tax=Paracoccus onubensis TaxID=1675788 RepID=UPI00272FE829|nr:hypothetical protein [Paracoccus onubensis]MDP0925685.1 hypothetical protein [Paracoccus onubensis]